jgi:predicted Zn-dependent peptidase
MSVQAKNDRRPPALLRRGALAAGLAVALAGGAAYAPSVAFAAPAAPAAQAALQGVDIPYQSFVLPNGLRGIVHEDHKAPVVSVAIW